MNFVLLTGNLATDVEIKETASGKTMATFSLAVTKQYNVSTGENVADFFDVILWEKQADYAYKYLSKGKKIALTGKLETNTYTDKDGVKRKVFKVVGEKIDTFFGIKKSEETVNSYVSTHSNKNSKPDLEPITINDLPF